MQQESERENDDGIKKRVARALSIFESTELRAVRCGRFANMCDACTKIKLPIKTTVLG